MVVLRGERVLLRPGRSEDAETLVRIRNDPEAIQRWGNVPTEQEIIEQFVETYEGFVIEVGGEVVDGSSITRRVRCTAMWH